VARSELSDWWDELSATFHDGRYRCALVLDVDETLLNPLERWRDAVARDFHLELTVDEIEAAGGLDPMLRYRSDYVDFVALANRLRGDLAFNSDLPAVEGALDGVRALERLSKVKVAFYLTTRPDVVRLETSENLRAVGFPDRPVITRPVHVSRDQTAEWKADVLVEFVTMVRPTLVIVVDDNPNLAAHIPAMKINLLRPLLLLGPLSNAVVDREAFEELHGVPTASWPDVPRIVETMLDEEFDRMFGEDDRRD